MKYPILISLILAAHVFAGTSSTPFALEMRQRNSLASNYVSPNLYAAVPPGNAPGLMLYTGAGDAECVILGNGLQWTPENPGVGTHGRLDVTLSGGTQSDWNAVTGGAVILNKPTLSLVATSGAYTDLSGLPALGTAAAQNSGVFATAAQGSLAASALQPAAIGVSVQAHSAALGTFSTNGSAYYLNRANHTGTQPAGTIGDFSAAVAALIPANVSAFTNDAGFITSSALSPYATTAALTSGLAGKFNSPSGSISQYLRGDGTLAAFPTIPTVPSNVSAFTNDAGYLAAPALAPYATTASVTSGLSAKFNTPAGTTAQYLRGDGTAATFPTIPAAQVNADWNSASGVSRILNKPTIPAAQVQSDWNAVSGLGVILNKPTIPVIAAPVFSNPTRPLNSAFQISATRMAYVAYFVDIATSISLTGGQAGHVFLEFADDAGMTTNLNSFGPVKNVQTGALTIGLSLNQTVTALPGIFIPAGKYVRIRTVNATGTPVFTSLPGQEVLM